MQSVRRLTTTLIFTTGVISATYGAMFAVLADYREKYGITEGQIGLIVAAGFFTSFLAQILLAPMADRGHARTLMLIGVGLTAVGTIGMGFTKSLVPLLLSRILMGCGAGLANPALRRIFILIDPDRVGANLGKLLATDVGGFVAGPLVGALTVDRFGVAAPFVILSAVLLVCTPLLLSIHVSEGRKTATQELFAVSLLRNRGVLSAVLIGIAVYVMIGTFDSLWVLVMTDMNATKQFAKAGITIFAIPMIFFASYGGRLTQKHGPFRLASFGIMMGAAFMFCYGRLASPYVMSAFGALHGINDALTVTGTGVAVAMTVPLDRQAGAQGLLGGMQTLAGGVAAMGAGSLYGRTSRPFVFTVCALVMLALTAASVVLSTSSGYFNRRPEADVA